MRTIHFQRKRQLVSEQFHFHQPSGRVFSSSTHTLTVPISGPIGKAILLFPRVLSWGVHCGCRATLDLCLNFPEIHCHLCKSAQEVRVRGLCTMQEMRDCSQNFPARSHICLCVLSKWRKEISLLRVKMASRISTLYTDRQEAASGWSFCELWGTPVVTSVLR